MLFIFELLNLRNYRSDKENSFELIKKKKKETVGVISKQMFEIHRRNDIIDVKIEIISLLSVFGK